MSLYSCGILIYRFKEDRLQILLVHPGGPFWKNKDRGAWSIPKGINEKYENPLDVAKREFREETGYEVDGEFIDLGEAKQPSRKIVHAWAIEKDIDTSLIKSNTFTQEWPPNSGHINQYPEVDKGQFFYLDDAKKKILKGQLVFIDRLIELLNYQP